MTWKHRGATALARLAGIHPDTVRSRLRRGYTWAEALGEDQRSKTRGCGVHGLRWWNRSKYPYCRLCRSVRAKGYYQIAKRLRLEPKA